VAQVSFSWNQSITYRFDMLATVNLNQRVQETKIYDQYYILLNNRT